MRMMFHICGKYTRRTTTINKIYGTSLWYAYIRHKSNLVFIFVDAALVELGMQVANAEVTYSR